MSMPVVRISLAAAALLVVGAGSTASAQSVCAKLWFRVAAEGAKTKAACHAKAAVTGAPVNPACLAAAEEKLVRKWNKATIKGDCPTAAQADDAQEVVDAFVADVVALLTPTPPLPSRCCATGSSCFAGPPIDESACLELLGTMGPPGSVCDGATGACVAPPGAGGSCCMLPQFSVCNAGPEVTPAGCVTGGGLDVPNAVCRPDGACAFP